MKVARNIADYTIFYDDLGPARPRIAYVPTMGALHAGHRSLIRLAKAAGEFVVVSIFVNPLQFGPSEDYARYPRPLDADLAVCREEGVDIVLTPSVADLYPAGRQVSVSAGTLGTILEGRARPGHFDGVLTVVLKLFNIVRPDIAVFGRKDAQQLACVERMIIDLNLNVEVLGAPTIREPDGLATSSRNVYLASSERQAAVALSAALGRAALETSVPAARSAAYEVLDQAAEDPAFQLDYATLVSPQTFSEVADDYTGRAIFVVAATVGKTRLIDNSDVACTPLPATAG